MARCVRFAGLFLIAAAWAAVLAMPTRWWIQEARIPAMSCAHAAEAEAEVMRGERRVAVVAVRAERWVQRSRATGEGAGSLDCDGQGFELASAGYYDPSGSMTLPPGTTVKLRLRTDGRVDAVQYCLGCSFEQKGAQPTPASLLALLGAALVALGSLAAARAVGSIPGWDTPWIETTSSQPPGGDGPFRGAHEPVGEGASVVRYRQAGPSRYWVGEAVDRSRHPLWALPAAPACAAVALMASSNGPIRVAALAVWVASGPILFAVALAARRWALSTAPGELSIERRGRALHALPGEAQTVVRALERRSAPDGGEHVVVVADGGTERVVERRSPPGRLASPASRARARAISAEIDVIADELARGELERSRPG